MATTTRISGLKNHDNTSAVLSNDSQSPAYASTIALSLSKAKTIVQVGTLTGVLTMSANVVSPGTGLAKDGPFVGDEVEIYLVSDGTSRVVTFGTGFLSTGTLSVTTAKFARISFKFNGTGWLESGRAVSA